MLLPRRTKIIVFLCKSWLKIFNFHKRKAKWNLFYSSVPVKLSQLAQLPAPPPLLYQLSLSSFDHHLNYLLSCPPDGFFANHNFFVDGRGIMTAEACAVVAQQNTKRGQMDVDVSAEMSFSTACTRIDTNTFRKDTTKREEAHVQPCCCT